MQNGERQVAPTRDLIRKDHTARYEWAVAQLKTLVPDGGDVLDAACGVGYGTQLLAQSSYTAFGLDRDLEALAYARKNYPHKQASYDCADLSGDLELATYHAAVCFETIEHLEDPLPLLKRLRQSCPVLLASVPNEAVFPYQGHAFHHCHYTQSQFQTLLAAAGWQVDSWWGQLGPHSLVEPDIQGRTLLAVCSAGPVVESVEPDPTSFKVAAPAHVPEHVAIIGLGPSCREFFELTRRLGGVSAYCDEVWGVNAIGDVLRCDRIFHMDDLRIQEARAHARPDSNIAAMVRWLKAHPGPVYTSVVREGYPGLVAFPLQDVLNGGYDTNGGAPYFNSTAAYAIAYAVHIGVKKISLFGMDYTLPNAHNAEKGRACCEFWLGIAAARGIQISVPETTSLLDACEPEESRLYGYDCVEVTLRDHSGGVEVLFKDRDVIPSADEIERRYDHSKHPSPLMQKAPTEGAKA